MSIDAQALRIVEDALGIEDTGQRSAFVVAQCADNAELRARVEQLLSLENSHARLSPTESFVRPIGVIEAIPDRIGPYRVTGEIARGGMGAVVRAERDDGVFERAVAIKLIRSDVASERTCIRFAEERRILARLSHPGIVRILDGGEVDNRPWLAMDYVEGKPVTEALVGASHEARLDAFEAVCEAVAYAHRNLVVHADIKPSNVLMTEGGGVHLLDFGIARLIVDLDKEEAGDPYPLTKGYAAPERAVGVAPTIASDVFSLGVLLLGMLGKDTPESDGDFVSGTRLPLGALDGDLAAIVGKALAEEPAQRYADVTELLADVRRHRNFQPVTSREPAGWLYHSGLFLRRHRRGVVLTGLAVLALTATTVVSTVSYFRAERARDQADARFVELRGLAQFMLTELNDRMSDAPGTVAARARLAEVAGHYLERLRSVPDAPIDLRLDAARGYIRLARLQGLSGTANLGRPEQAAKSLDRAQGILDTLDGKTAGVSTALGEAALARWSLSSDTEGPGWTAKAETYFDRALAQSPGDKTAALGLLTVRKNQGFDLTTSDKTGEALVVLQKALTGLRAAQWPYGLKRDAKLLEVNLLARIGDAFYYKGNVANALNSYRESAAAIRAEIAKAPSLMWQEKLGEAQWNISGTLGEIDGRASEALAAAEHGILEMERTLSFGADAAIEQRLIILLGQKALLLDDLGRTREAASVSARGIAMRRQRLAESPRDVTSKRDLAVGLAAHADILAKSGNRRAACAAAMQGRRVFADLHRHNDLSARDLRLELPKIANAAKRYCD